MSELMQDGRSKLRPAADRPPTPTRVRPPGSPGAPSLQDALAAELNKAMARRREVVFNEPLSEPTTPREPGSMNGDREAEEWI